MPELDLDERQLALWKSQAEVYAATQYFAYDTLNGYYSHDHEVAKVILAKAAVKLLAEREALCDLVRKQQGELETTAMIPYTCPVCGGRGTVQHGFYDQAASATSTEREICCSCQATGIIWSLPGKEVSHDTKRD